MRLVFHPEARSESIEAAAYYEARSPGVGIALLDALDEAYDTLLQNPTASARVDFDVRQYNLPGFPYGILYRVVQDQLYVVAVKHHSRDSDYWKHRIQK